MAKAQQEKKKHKGERNDERRNGKAWKRRSCCAKRHGPGYHAPKGKVPPAAEDT